MLSVWHKDFQNLDTKCLPRSDTMSDGAPCLENTWRRKRRATPSVSTFLCVGMKSAIFVSRHTTTKIASKPSERGKPSMKSMEMDDQGCSGMGRNRRGP